MKEKIILKAQARCTLCASPTNLFYKTDQSQYHRCLNCSAVMLDFKYFLSKQAEKIRYEEHNNDVEDAGYQKFVAPIVNEIVRKFNVQHLGLDFGAGTGPVISKLLSDKGFRMRLYDPFFFNDTQSLKSKYDFIVCCEVIEHFHNPSKEFKLLKSLLNQGGILYCMTDIYTDKTNFKDWYYKNDPAHVFFYHKTTIEWIKKYFNFSGFRIQGRLIQFRN